MITITVNHNITVHILYIDYSTWTYYDYIFYHNLATYDCPSSPYCLSEINSSIIITIISRYVMNEDWKQSV